MIRASTAILTLCMVTSGGPAAVFGQETEAERSAQTAAEAWLELIDAEQYTESWNDAAPAVQEAVTAEQWADQVGSARQQVGALQERTVEAAESVMDPPNSPPGEYFILTYESTFANVPNATETVVTMKQEDGSWKVAGYLVRPA